MTDKKAKGTNARTECFAPMPMRALVDRRLKGKGDHIRVLGIIAAHDRFSANGTGCCASHKRISDMAGCDYSNLSKIVRDLGEWGYLEWRANPGNHRNRIYTVLYTSEDSAAMRGVIVGAQTNNDGEIVGADTNNARFSVGVEKRQVPDFYVESERNILSQTHKISCRNREDISPKDATGVASDEARDLGRQVRAAWNDPDTLYRLGDAASEAKFRFHREGHIEAAAKAHRTSASALQRYYDLTHDQGEHHG